MRGPSGIWLDFNWSLLGNNWYTRSTGVMAGALAHLVTEAMEDYTGSESKGGGKALFLGVTNVTLDAVGMFLHGATVHVSDRNKGNQTLRQLLQLPPTVQKTLGL